MDIDQPVPPELAQVSPGKDLPFREKVRALVDVTGEDYQRATRRRKVGLWATASLLAYEWGPGNETVTPIIATSIMSQTEGLEGALLTTSIAGGFTAAQQLTSGYLAAYSAEGFPGTAQKIYEFASVDENGEAARKPYKELKESTKTLYATALGSSFVVAREAAATGSTERKQLNKQVHASALRSSLAVAALTGVASPGLEAATESTEGTAVEQPVDFLVNTVENPLVWLSGATLALAYGGLRKKLAARRAA